jgi:hypothetical protein
MNRSTALVSTLAVLGTAGLVHATNARVESMGKHDTYFMDDVSIWSNPANANIYPNYLIGELGQMRYNAPVTNGAMDMSALARYNKDPQAPWFGAVFAKSFSADANSGNRYPQFVVGGAFNRNDDLLKYLPAKVQLNHADGDTVLAMQDPAVKFDALVGFATSNGMLFGAKLYMAMGDSSSNAASAPVEKLTNLWAATLGANLPLAQGLDVELAFTAATIDAEATARKYSYKSESDLSLMGSARAFIMAPAISGVVVPSVSVRQMDAPGIENDIRLTAGSGVNVSLDRGFFWIGADYTMSSTEIRLTADGAASSDKDVSVTTMDANSARVSFGIERNVWWDWFVLRVGGQKVFTGEETSYKGMDGKTVTVTDITTNPEGDGTENDHVSFGFGLNIEDKLKVDAVVAEDILFTGGNLFGGPADHVLSRVSATYSF